MTSCLHGRELAFQPGAVCKVSPGGAGHHAWVCKPQHSRLRPCGAQKQPGFLAGVGHRARAVRCSGAQSRWGLWNSRNRGQASASGP